MLSQVIFVILDFILKETKKIDLIFHLAALISIPYSYESTKKLHCNKC